MKLHTTIVATWMTVAAATTFASPPVEDLLENVAAIDTGGNPASLVVWGSAEPLVVAPDGRIFAAAGELGRGRIVALGHGGFVQTDAADAEIFAANALEWLASGVRSRRGEPIRIFGLTEPVAAEFEARGSATERISGKMRDLNFSAVDVIVASPQSFLKAGRYEELREWISRGGGLLATETAWGVLQLNRDLTLDTLAANRLLQEVGMRFTGQAHSGYGPEKNYPVDQALLENANADRALDVLAGKREGDAAFCARVVGFAFANVPLDSPFIKSARRLANTHKPELDALYRNAATAPIKPNEHALARALFDLDSRLSMELPPRQLKAHASSEAFPGPAREPRSPRVRLELDTAVPGWHTTGLYARPGEVIRVVVQDEAAWGEVVVQIGAWRDPHNHSHRVRMKNALRRFPVEARNTEIASAIGGPIYLDFPVGLAERMQTPTIVVTVHGAARAPRYRLGETDLDEWREKIRHIDSPWAEMESEHLIFTVPSSAIRDVDRPDLVMQHWNSVHEAMQELEPRTSNHWADRPYRYVADISVSWGYMYCPADGPIVIPSSAAAAMFDLENFDAAGPNNLWGHYHEMGHAHQNPLWTDGATGEVTVNIFTVYALHTVNGYPLEADVMRTDPNTAWRTFDNHRQTGKPFEDVGGPFPRLQLYALLWHHFGFDAFRKTFARIRSLQHDRPTNTIAERNTFLVTFSEVVERSLVPYFEAWGVEVTDDSRERLRNLSPWMPDEPASE